MIELKLSKFQQFLHHMLIDVDWVVFACEMNPEVEGYFAAEAKEVFYERMMAHNKSVN